MSQSISSQEMTGRKRLLYLMHVNWYWIKQRPQFLAEQLSQEYDVVVICEASYRNKELVRSEAPQNIKLKELSRLPFGRFRLVRWLNNLLYRRRLKKLVASSDSIWLTHPDCYSWVNGLLTKHIRVIYDCMDDALQVPNLSSFRRAQLQALEAELVDRADAIFASAINLKTKLVERYGIESERVKVINNATHIYEQVGNPDSEAFLHVRSALNATPHRKIIYLGTIEKWVDFDLIHQALERYTNLAFYFIGPIKHHPKSHERLQLLPPVPHSDVGKIMQMSDALIMPFKVDDFIQGVNPVKVYEYIYALRPAIIVSYPETKIFEPYVHLYASEAEFFTLLERLSDDQLAVKVSSEAAMSFIEENTWIARANTMLAVLRDL